MSMAFLPSQSRKNVLSQGLPNLENFHVKEVQRPQNEQTYTRTCAHTRVLHNRITSCHAHAIPSPQNGCTGSLTGLRPPACPLSSPTVFSMTATKVTPPVCTQTPNGSHLTQYRSQGSQGLLSGFTNPPHPWPHLFCNLTSLSEPLTLSTAATLSSVPPQGLCMGSLCPRCSFPSYPQGLLPHLI